MNNNTNEQALEDHIEQHLLATGYVQGQPRDFDAKFALDTEIFWQFLNIHQSDELDKLRHQPDYQRKIIGRLDNILKKEGLLYVLRKGLTVENAKFELLYPSPLASSTQSIHDDYRKNVFSITRQVRYNTVHTGQEIDVVIFINGLPISTIELKNHWTGQTARINGQKQYKNDRDPKQPLLQFARSLVHFTADTDEVYMTTKLNGKDTYFLPFNKGNGKGAGNPPNPQGYKTAYLWEEVLQKDSLVNIIFHFMRLAGEGKEKDINKKTLFFPRYQQLDVVRKLINHTHEHGTGHSYLIQHSAGSGKSNSITWLAYQLIDVYAKQAQATDAPLFDSVIVVTDRRLLDKQIKDNIAQFSQVKNITAHAIKSSDLKQALHDGKRIIITTLQKFPFILDGIDDLSDKNFAVIIDEAHSSQGGSTASKMNEALGNASDSLNHTDDDDVDPQDKIIKLMQARKMKKNASYFAFTATPKNNTLEKFGEKQADGSFQPFHLYSMKQAIEEGFILDVLSNYTTYKSFYEIKKSIEENPLFDTAKAQKTIRAKVEKDPKTIAVKAEIMLNHFMDNVYKKAQLKGQAKGMVITGSIEHAIRYYQALKKLLIAKDMPFDVLVAFSDKKVVDGIEYTEAGMNGFSNSDTKDMFDKGYTGETRTGTKKPTDIDENKYRLLVVADKYLTGFDQPKLCSMYVDKKLSGVLAVQALSRLNRSANKLGKTTQSLFVLDFFNELSDIKTAFDPYYTSTTLSEATDVNVLHDLKESLGDVGVYEQHEVKHFTEQFFANVDGDEISALVDVAVQRFEHELELEAEEKVDFKIKAKQFVKIYGQMASLLEYEQVEWEELYWLLKFLIPKLMVRTQTDDMVDKLLESVDLSTYGVARSKLNNCIELNSEDSELDPQNPNMRGISTQEQEEDTLDAIITSFNDKWFADWSDTPADQREKLLKIGRDVQAHEDFEATVKNNTDPQTRDLSLNKIIDDVMRDHRKREVDLYKLYKDDSSQFGHALKHIVQEVLGIAC